MTDDNNIHDNFESILATGQKVKEPRLSLILVNIKKAGGFIRAVVNNKNKKILIIALILVMSVYGLTFYLWQNSQRSNNISQNKDDVRKLIDKVGLLIVLPTDEEPTVATVSDPSKLRDQPFFIDAKVGYKVLVYAKAKRAILYDPVFNKIVNVAPINIGQPNK